MRGGGPECDAEAANLATIREVRGAAQAGVVQRLAPGAFFGDSAIEPDLGRLLLEELAKGPRFIVECGSGSSTLLIARSLENSGRGKLLALENDPRWAESVRARLSASGLEGYADVVTAPLVEQRFGPRTIPWYDVSAFSDRITETIDLLLVDGPPSSDRWARWPALAALYKYLSGDARVLLDDGRRRGERLTAFQWLRAYPDLSLYWVDTVKGTWKLVRRSEPPPSRLVRTALAIRRQIHPRPPGFGLGTVRR